MERLFDPDPETADDGRPVRPCIQCRQPLTFPSQPGDATCPHCRVVQYLAAPTPLYPTGGQGRYA